MGFCLSIFFVSNFVFVCIYKTMFEEFEKKDNVSLKNYSTIKIGGNAKVIVFPKNINELIEILKIIKKNKQKYIILGNGSNILFPDKFFEGVVVSLKNINHIEKKGKFVYVGAGVNLFALNISLANFGLSGLEWSYGIPASMGGFVIMNGGCFEHEIGEFVEELLVLRDEKLEILKRENLLFEYRNSNLRKEKYIVLSVKLRLFKEKTQKIREKMQFFYDKKKNSQPCDLPSLGSVFKRIDAKETIYPAKIIDNLGLKGVRINGAEISKKHAGFIVNVGGATCQDVVRLVKLVEEKLAQVGVFPEREIIVLQDKENCCESGYTSG